MSVAKCQNDKHNQKSIQHFCIAENCRKTRALCNKCVQENQHSGHTIVEFDDEKKEFLVPKTETFTRIMNKLDELKRNFDYGIQFIKKALQSNYLPPDTLTEQGVQQLNDSITKLLKLDFLERLIIDRLDSIVEQTLKQMKYTYQDLTCGAEKECYEIIQKQQWDKFEEKWTQAYQSDPKNIMLQLSRVEALRLRKDVNSALQLCEKLLQQERNNPWIQYEMNNLTQILDRR